MKESMYGTQHSARHTVDLVNRGNLLPDCLSTYTYSLEHSFVRWFRPVPYIPASSSSHHQQTLREPQSGAQWRRQSTFKNQMHVGLFACAKEIERSCTFLIWGGWNTSWKAIIMASIFQAWYVCPFYVSVK